MQRFAPYLGIVAAIGIAAFIYVFGSSAQSVRPALTPAPAATSTIAVVPDVTLPTISLPDALKIETATTTPAPIPVPTKPVPKTSVPVATSTPVSVLVPSPAPRASSGDIGLDAAATALRGALVNIICYMPPGSGARSISGSGVMVDPKGIILTNAHVAQYFLLADRGADCTIRAGSPAKDSYDAALIYISPVWLRANASVITEAAPSGTGEHDFAFLAITKSATAVALPSSFPAIPLATRPVAKDTPIVIGSYGAQFLDPSQVQSALYPTLVFGSVKDIFTFAVNTIDVLALGGSAAAQEGSSGGGVATAAGELVGTITTSTMESSTASRSLDAITASYIRAEYASEMGSALDLLLAKSPSVAVTDFAPRIANLEALLTAHLP